MGNESIGRERARGSGNDSSVAHLLGVFGRSDTFAARLPPMNSMNSMNVIHDYLHDVGTPVTTRRGFINNEPDGTEECKGKDERTRKRGGAP